MIRMGRGNRPDLPDTGDVNRDQKSAEPAYRYASEVQPPAASRAISESDSMARDIKEGRLSGFVGHGTTLTGETEFHAMLRVDGHLIGTVTSEAGTLIIGTNGQVDANVMVAAAMINGTVNGDVIASEKLQLGRTARVLGNIQSPRLIVEEGAILEGSCSMLKAREVQEEEVASAEYEEQQSLIAQPVEDEPQSSDMASYMLSDSDDDGEEGDEEAAADAAAV
jgi:cytoskeletal protein CcmA (bactofilin family)